MCGDDPLLQSLLNWETNFVKRTRVNTFHKKLIREVKYTRNTLKCIVEADGKQREYGKKCPQWRLKDKGNASTQLNK